MDLWQELTYKKFDKKDINIISAGVNGETAQDGYYRLEFDVLSQNPDLVTVMFGHNEFMSGVRPEIYYMYLAKIVQYLKHKGVIAVWLLSPNRVKFEEDYQPYIERINMVAKEEGARFVDVWRAFDEVDLDTIYTFKFDYGGYNGQDFVHPNGKGHRLIAEYLMKELVEAFY